MAKNLLFQNKIKTAPKKCRMSAGLYSDEAYQIIQLQRYTELLSRVPIPLLFSSNYTYIHKMNIIGLCSNCLLIRK
jgi:hypothetical protein